MAFIQCEFKSAVLDIGCSLNVILNETALKQNGPGHRSPVLYLLHGLSDNHAGWIRNTSIERYAEAYDVAIVMPAINRSFYTNMHAGYKYFDFIAKEVPQVAQSFFPIAPGRSNTFVAGLSMGGYGAFKLAMSKPNEYAAAISLSGALDLGSMECDRDDMLPEWENVFGNIDAFKDGENDLLGLATKLQASDTPKPAFYQYCGTDDFLYPVNTSFLQHCKRIGLEIDYSESEGDHNWEHWDREIQAALDWLPLKKVQPS